MSLFLETIKVFQRNLCNLKYHNQRLNYTIQSYFKDSPCLNIEDFIRIPYKLDDNLYKCRVLYSSQIEKIEFIPYNIKTVKSLKIVNADNLLDYSFKFVNRDALDKLFQKRKNCDC